MLVSEIWPSASARHDHGDGLVASVAADAGDDGHERGERHQLYDRILEGADDARGDDGGDEIDGDPGPAIAHRLPHAGEQVLGLAHARTVEPFALGLLAHHVHDVVHGDAPEQAIVFVHHRRRDQIIALERRRHLLCPV